MTPPSGTGIVVPAGAQRVLPLAGLALGEQSPVIRVTSAEAPVQAALQASITRTLVPGGVDQVGATSAPSESQVIPAFSVTTRPGDAGASDTTTLLRLLAPSAGAEASVTVSRVGARGAGGGTAVRIGVVAVLVGVLGGGMLPTLAEGSLGGGSGGTGGTGTSLDPVAAMRGQLTRDEPVDLLRELEENAPFDFNIRRTADDNLVLDVDDDQDPEQRAA